MIFLSKLINQPVTDVTGRRIGQVADLVIELGDVFPRVMALVLHMRRGQARIPLEYFEPSSIENGTPHLKIPAAEVQDVAASGDGGEIYLMRDVLDKQIVDTQGRRIVKVNDLKLAEINDQLRLVGIDIGLRAFLRRLGGERTAGLLSYVLPIKLPERLITWNYIEPLEPATNNDVRLNIPQTRLSELRPADLADIIEQMSASEGRDILNTLETSVAAEALEEMEPAKQAAILDEISSERASDLLEALPPDEAADILGDLPDAKAQELLSLMQPEEAAPLRELLKYNEHSAGGIMNPEVFRLRVDLTAEQTIEKLRQEAPTGESIYYLYVTDGDDHLVGVLSLRDLVTAPPATPIRDLMRSKVIKVDVNADQADVAELISRYDLLAIPVVDKDDELQGIVTVDDVIDVIHEEAVEDISQTAATTIEDIQQTNTWWQAAYGRALWLSLSLIGGLLGSWILALFAPNWSNLTGLIYFVPLLLLISNGVSTQTIAVVGHALAEGWSDWSRTLARELRVGGILSIVTGGLVAIVAGIWLGHWTYGVAVGVSLLITIMLTNLTGVLLPLGLRRLRLEPTLLSGPVLASGASIIGLLVYFLLSSAMLPELR